MMIRREQRDVWGGVVNCPAIAEGNISSGTANLWQTVHSAGCWKKSLPLAVINEHQNLATVFCLQYKSEFMASEKIEFPKGWHSRYSEIETYHYYDGPNTGRNARVRRLHLGRSLQRLEVTSLRSTTTLTLWTSVSSEPNNSDISIKIQMSCLHELLESHTYLSLSTLRNVFFPSLLLITVNSSVINLRQNIINRQLNMIQ